MITIKRRSLHLLIHSKEVTQRHKVIIHSKEVSASQSNNPQQGSNSVPQSNNPQQGGNRGFSDFTFTNDSIKDFMANPEKFESLYTSFKNPTGFGDKIFFEADKVSLSSKIHLNDKQLDEFLGNFNRIQQLDYNSKNVTKINLKLKTTYTQCTHIKSIKFNDCEHLTELYINNNKNSCLDISINGCKKLKNIYLNEGIIVSKINDNPEIIDIQGGSSLSNQLYIGSSQLKNLRITNYDSVKTYIKTLTILSLQQVPDLDVQDAPIEELILLNLGQNIGLEELIEIIKKFPVLKKIKLNWDLTKDCKLIKEMLQQVYSKLEICVS